MAAKNERKNIKIKEACANQSASTSYPLLCASKIGHFLCYLNNRQHFDNKDSISN